MSPIPFHTIDWSKAETKAYQGETGIAYWKTMQYPGLRIRMVEYSAGYKADHWCAVGHLLFCIKGELISELSDGSQYLLTEGMSYHVSDNLSKHRSHTTIGATLFIIDGDFLSKETMNYKNAIGLQ